MTGLTVFIEARLAEDEAAAGATTEHADGQGENDPHV